MLLGFVQKDGACGCHLCDWAAGGGDAALRAHLGEVHQRYLLGREERKAGGAVYRGPRHEWVSLEHFRTRRG